MPTPRRKKTHDDYLKCVCLVCMKKSKENDIRDKHYESIARFVVSGLDRHDPRLPKSICPTCLRILNFYEQGDFSRTIKVFDYSKLSSLKPITRSSTDCSCHVCAIARSNPIGQCRESGTEDKTNPKEHPKHLKVCSKCLCPIGKGKPHDCSPTKRRENLINFLVQDAETPLPKTSEQVIAHCLKRKVSDTNSNSLKLSQQGTQLRCEINPSLKKNEHTTLTVEDMLTMKSNLNFGVNTTLKVAKELRFGYKNRRAVGSGLKDALVEQNKLVDGMFGVDVFDFCTKEGMVKRPVIFCSDALKLLDGVIEKRDLEFERFDFKIGIDGGGGFVKICQNIVRRQEEETTKKRRLYKDGIEGEAHADTSVHKLLILAIVPDVPETYENVSDIWKMVDLKPLEEYGDVKIAADLKLCNIMLGLQSHASNHPCSWCNIEK